MDADFFAEIDLGPIEEILSCLDPEIGEVLSQLSRKTCTEVSGELIGKFNMKALFETRTEIFRAALDKVDYCLSQIAKARDSNNVDLSESEARMIDKAERLFRSLMPKDMIKRKCPKKLVNDIFELLSFAAEERTKFPMALMKGTTSQGKSLSPHMLATAEDLECIQLISERISGESTTSSEHSFFDDDDTRQVPENDETTVIYNPTEVSMSAAPLYPDEEDSDNYGAVKENGLSRSSENLMRAVINAEKSICEDLCGFNDEIIAQLTSITQDEVDMNNLIPDRERCDSSDNRPESPNTNPLGTNTMPIEDKRNTVGHRNTDAPAHANQPTTENSPLRSTLVCPDPKAHRIPVGNTTCESVRHSGGEIVIRLIIPTLGESYTPELSQPTRAENTNMSERYSGEKRDRRRDDPSKRNGDERANNDRFSALERWKESFTRRTFEAEEEMNEKFRRMQVENDAMADELRRVKRRVNKLTNATQAKSAPTNKESVDIVKGADKDKNSTDDKPREVETGGDRRNWVEVRKRNGARPRAASYAGNTRMRGLNDPPPLPRTEQQPKQHATRSRTEKASNPQKQVRMRDERRKADGDDEGQKRLEESAMRNWLTKVKPAGKATKDVKVSHYITPPIPAPVSPSWADDDPESDNDGDIDPTTGTTPVSVRHSESDDTPSPTTPDERERQHDGRHSDYDDEHSIPPSGQVSETWMQENGGNRRRNGNNGGSSRPTTRGYGSPDSDDVYALPPSGQAIEARKLRNGGGRNNPSNNFGGARPKMRGKGPGGNNNESNVSMYKPAQKPKTGPKDDGKSETVSYARVLTGNGWKTVPSKKRKFDKVSPKSRPLKGIAASNNRDIYLQGLVVGVYESEDDVIESVRVYCIDRGITPVFIRNIPVKFDCTRTGCRLTVRDEDYDDVIMNSFWPEHISARDWTPRVRGNDQ